MAQLLAASFRPSVRSRCQTKLCSRQLERRNFHKTSYNVWHVNRESRIAAVAAGIFNRATSHNAAGSKDSMLHSGVDSGSELPTLEAMGPFAISRAVNGLALCNRFLEKPKDPSALPSSHRVAFMPANRVFVKRTDMEKPNPLEREEDELRRSVELSLRLVSPPSRPAAAQDPGIDIINVASRTDVLRLSGLVFSRWCETQNRVSPPVILQALGPRCISNMVRALALTWERSTRSHEVGDDSSEPGFFCLPSHIQLSDDAPGQYSGLQCELLSPGH